MSDSLLAKLPRFDAPTDRPPAEMLGTLLGRTAPAPPPEPVAPLVEDAPAPEVTAPAPEPEEERVSLQEVEALTAQFAQQLDDMDARVRADVTAGIQAISERLFPRLSQHFLAEEIGRHLPELVPVSVPHLEIKASPMLVEQLQPVIARTPILAKRCQFETADDMASGHVSVSWQTGGLAFDFDGLMEACLAELESN